MGNRTLLPRPSEEKFGRIQIRVTLVIVLALVPLMILIAWLILYFQRQDMENLLLEKAETVAVSGAANIELFWEQAIINGDLTREQIFDTDYVRFWTFDPAAYPDFEGDPRSLDKYHTQYDAYTDEYWQDLLDAYLASEDIIFAVASDVNGYVPTHNERWTSGDGSPATDRAKRIFDDPVGLAAARNTESVLHQIYQRAGTGETLWDVSAPVYVDGEHWGAFRVGMELAQNQARVTAALWRTVFMMSFVVVVLSGVALGLGRYIADPITRLTEAAQRMSKGDLEQHVEIPHRDEITVLAQAFNTMTDQLREMVFGLEQRVAERTQGLLTAAEVSSSTTAELDLETLLPKVVELVRERFDLYYVGLFLKDEADEYAVLRAGSGQAGRAMLARQHRLPIDATSMIGRCVLTGEADVQFDVGEAAVHFSNPDLPDTRSELALPLRSGSQILGAMTVQSEHEAYFSQEDITVLQTVADQVANAVQNARLFQQLQESLAAEQRAYGELTHQAWQELLQAQSELGFLSDRHTTIPAGDLWRPEMQEALRIGKAVMGTDENTLALPIKVRGQVVGVIDGRKSDGAEWLAEEVELLTAIVEQLNLALEGAQLYRDTQRRAARERVVAEVSDRMQQTLDMETVLQTVVEEMQRVFSLAEAEVRLGVEWEVDEA